MSTKRLRAIAVAGLRCLILIQALSPLAFGQAATAEQEFAAALVAAKSEDDRELLLNRQRELVTAGLGKALSDIGSRAYVKGDYARALDAFQLAQNIGERVADKAGVALALSGMGATHFSRGNHALSLQFYEKSLLLARELNDRAAIARAVNGIGNAYFYQGRYEQAMVNYQESLRLQEEAGNRAEIARAQNNIANVEVAQGRYIEALQHYQETLKVNEELGEKAGASRVLYNIGQIYFSQGSYDLALEYYNRSLALARALGRKAGVASTLRSIGNVQYATGQHRPALDSYRDSLKLSEEMGDKPGIAACLSSIGSVYFASGDYGRALDYYTDSLKLAEQAGNRAEVGRVLDKMASASLRLGNYDAALDLYRKSLAAMEESRSKTGVASALRSLAVFHKLRGDYARSLEFSLSGLKIADELRDDALAAQLLLDAADAQYSQRSYVAALETISRSSPLASRIGDNRLLGEILTFEGRIHGALNAPDKALDAFERASEAVERWSRDSSGARWSQGFLEHKSSPYGYAVALLIDKRRFAEAFEYAERAKGQELLDALQGGWNVTKGMAESDLREERELRARISSLRAQLAHDRRARQPDEAQLTELNDRLGASLQAYEKFREGLYARHARLKSLRGEARPLTVAEAAHLIPDENTALLEFLISEERLYLFVLTRAGSNARKGDGAVEMEAYPLPVNVNELERLVRDFKKRLAERGGNYEDAARQLYGLLMARAEKQLRGRKTLCIAPHGFLWSLPFQALMTTRNKFLIEEYAVSYAPSLTAYREMMRSPEVIGERLKAEGGKYDALHLASPGILEDLNAMDAREIAGMDLTAGLVILPAGRAAREDADGGKGLIAMSWAWHIAGCPATILDEWSGDSSQAQLLIRFHKDLIDRRGRPGSTLSMPESLRQAALELLRSEQYRHPFYWAGFKLIGKTVYR